METRKRISLTVFVSLLTEIHQIAELEGRPDAEVVRLLLKAGLRAYRRGRPLLCGYPHCTRKECCGPEVSRGQIINFPQAERDH